MKPRHAAVLALVVWLLMNPPTQGAPAYILYHAPLSRWDVSEWYDTKAECQDRLKDITDNTQRDLDACTHGECAVNVARGAAGRCIASDDPRLKRK
jgi:hypothetical protein